MRFLIDMPLSQSLSVCLTSQGHDAFHARELGLNRAPDVEIIQRMKDILGSLGADEINQSIVVVASSSIRRRRLPI